MGRIDSIECDKFDYMVMIGRKMTCGIRLKKKVADPPATTSHKSEFQTLRGP